MILGILGSLGFSTTMTWERLGTKWVPMATSSRANWPTGGTHGRPCASKVFTRRMYESATMTTVHPAARATATVWVLRALLPALLLLVPVTNSGQEPEAPPGVDELLSAVVGVRARVPVDARTAEALGTERTGSGVVIDANGLVVTIGYLIMEASHVEVLVGEGRRLPAEILAYDHETGFGLLRSSEPIDVPPMER